MSRQKMIVLPDRIYVVSKRDEPPEVEEFRPQRWPRAMNVFAEEPDGSWRVRLKCPDGTIRKFRSRRTVPAGATNERRAMRSDLRYAVLSRDGFRCRYCGRSAPDVVLHVDHVVAIVNGGTSDMGNLVAACADCNLGKAAS